MLQRWLIFVLAIEMFAYAGLAVALGGPGWGLLSIALVIMTLGLLWRLSHAFSSFLVCGVLRLRERRENTNMLAALWGEFTSRLTSFNIAQPFYRFVMPDEPAEILTGIDAPASPPVLLVHGYFSNRGMWVRFRQRLQTHAKSAVEAGKMRGLIYTITLEPPFGTIESFAAQLHARIEAICAETNHRQVIVIAHSMGGLVTRAYMVEHGAARIAQFVTLGTPHHGTRTATLGIGACVKQMRWQGEWIASLLERERVAGGAKPPTVSIYTTNDDIVYPPESSQLSWAENIAVSGVGHVGLLFSTEIVLHVVQAINRSSNTGAVFEAEKPENTRQ